MKTIKELWNRELYGYKNKKIRVKNIIIIILIILLLLIVQRCAHQESNNQKIEAQKIEALKEPCQIIKLNLVDLEELLNRSDLCSEEWFKDYNNYLDRVKDQNRILKNEEDLISKELLILKIELQESLKEFYLKQDEATINDLKNKIEGYNNYYMINCEEKN